MTTQELKCVLMLSDTLNFSQAARELNITQPAFSRMIVRVEEELALKLFQRSTRSVQTSPEGKIFIAALRQAAAIYKDGIAAAKELERKGNTLNVSTMSEFVCAELAILVSEFRDQCPPTAFVECTPTLAKKIPDRLRNRQTDIGFLFTDIDSFGSEFSSKVLKRIPLAAVVNRRDPLSQMPILHAADLEKVNVITLDQSMGSETESYGAPLLVLNRKFGTHIKEGVIAKSTQESLIRVASGQGICIITSTLEHLLPSNCVMIPIEGLEFNLTALWNAGGISKLAKKFLQFIFDCYGV